MPARNKSKRKSKPRSKAKGQKARKKVPPRPKVRRPKKARKKAPPRPKVRRPKRMGRPPAQTADWTLEFLAGIQAGLHVRDAALAAKVDNTMPYHRRREDEAFALAWQQATEIGTKTLEAEAARRSYHGTLRPVFYKGFECGEIREYSDTLLMFLLRARKPKKYRERHKFEHTGADGAPLPGVNIYLPDNGRSKPDDAANDGDQAKEAKAASAAGPQ